MDVFGGLRTFGCWLFAGLLELCGIRTWDQRKIGMRDHVITADLGLNKRIDAEARSLSLTKEQVDTIRQPSVRVAAKRKADTP
jgi:hypothetical protein